MLDFENDPEAAWERAGMRVKGELLASLADLQQRSGLSIAEIAHHWHQALMLKLQREDLAAYIRFAERTGAHLTEDARALREIIDEDVRNHQVN